MIITDTQVNIVIARIVKKRSYKIIEQNIKRLIILVKLFYIELLSYKYLCQSIIRHFILVI